LATCAALELTAFAVAAAGISALFFASSAERLVIVTAVTEALAFIIALATCAALELTAFAVAAAGITALFFFASAERLVVVTAVAKARAFIIALAFRRIIELTAFAFAAVRSSAFTPLLGLATTDLADLPRSAGAEVIPAAFTTE